MFSVVFGCGNTSQSDHSSRFSFYSLVMIFYQNYMRQRRKYSPLIRCTNKQEHIVNTMSRREKTFQREHWNTETPEGIQDFQKSDWSAVSVQRWIATWVFVQMRIYYVLSAMMSIRSPSWWHAATVSVTPVFRDGGDIKRLLSDHIVSNRLRKGILHETWHWGNCVKIIYWRELRDFQQVL